MRTRTRAADVADAMRVLARERFLPAEQRDRAVEDRPLPLWHGQTSSQPSTVASMLRLLQVPVGARVLDVGSGSGWTTALLARLVGPGRHRARARAGPGARACGARRTSTRAACRGPRIEPATPGALGRPVDGGWDRILVSASPRSLPSVLVDQLAEGGRLVIPVRSTMHLVERTAGRTRVTTHGSYTFVPLR